MTRIRRVFAELEAPLAEMEYCIAEERRGSRDLTDKNVAEALDLLLGTYRTEESGIIYDRTSSDLRVDGIRRRLKEAVERLRSPKDSAARRLKLGETIDCLEVIRGFLSQHLESRITQLSYVDFLARLLPTRRRIEESGSSLIIPGR